MRKTLYSHCFSKLHYTVSLYNVFRETYFIPFGDDERLSVRPSTVASKELRVSVGAVGGIKFERTFYEGEILAISGEYCSYTLLLLQVAT